MDAALDWLNLGTALFLGKAGGIAGVLAIFGMAVAVGVAVAQYEGFSRGIGIFVVVLAVAATAWVLARPDHYRINGQYGFAIDVPVTYAIVEWSDGRIMLSGNGDDRVMFRTGEVKGSIADALGQRRQRWQQFAERHGATIATDIRGDRYAFVSWSEQDQPDQPATTTRLSGLVARQDGSVAHYGSIMTVTHGHSRDVTRIRQTLCASAGLDVKSCARRS